MRRNDTITAIASAIGRSPRGIVRASGVDAFEVLERASEPVAGRQRGLFHFRFGADLPCLMTVFPAPRSYTGEDSFELQFPGNPDLLQRCVNRLIDAGARAAEPGEFSARAYLNGRLTLTEAEGVSMTIAAASDAQLRAGRLLTSGRLGEFAHGLANELARTLALVEAGIDFTDQEDVVPISKLDLRRRLEPVVERLHETIARSTGAERLEAIPTVALCGPSNAGKSTLFNALLGRTRAVISEGAGTTRDVLREPMHLRPAESHSPEIMLVDLAGLDHSEAGLNPRMQRAANQALEAADLILRLEPADQRDSQFGSSHETDPRVIVVRSKSDLPPVDDQRAVRGFRVSAVTGENLGALRQLIADRLRDRTSVLGADAIALQPRHERALREAAERLQSAVAGLDDADGESSLADVEFIAADLRLALDAIGDLAGEITPDDVLGLVFAGFCIGK